jgi:hypothetical protein
MTIDTQTVPIDTNEAYGGWSQTQSTSDLRFCRRDGKLILQQRFVTTTQTSQASEWRDVPVFEA